jgi:hypothetical protein
LGKSMGFRAMTVIKLFLIKTISMALIVLKRDITVRIVNVSAVKWLMLAK